MGGWNLMKTTTKLFYILLQKKGEIEHNNRRNNQIIQYIMSELKEELKAKIIEQLNLEDISVDDIADDDALFGDGFGLDSIDALELIVMLDKDYGIRLSDPKEGKKIFESVQVMADYIQEHRTK